jgi:hypothetical protein
LFKPEQGACAVARTLTANPEGSESQTNPDTLDVPISNVTFTTVFSLQLETLWTKNVRESRVDRQFDTEKIIQDSGLSQTCEKPL